MTYVLEKITPEDQKKIIKDAEFNPNKQERLIYAVKHQEFTESWAIDRERNCYLLKMPSSTREEDWDTPYFIFVKGNMYRVNREGQAGNNVYFDEELLIAEPLFTELQEEIRAAFAIYGCWGDGPLNERGIPVWDISPKLTIKKVA